MTASETCPVLHNFANVVFFSAEYLLEDGRKGPKQFLEKNTVNLSYCTKHG